ncbi:unnamed protein product [Somion occarium]|uniref:HNH nuclease domain-containing protein n=1 Tax=Somion occarium TaxID=3059160 RepID=A0ABP1E2G0_9APHY
MTFQAGSEWFEVLRIPHHELTRFSKTPLKWLRFVAYCIFGVRGHLSSSANGSEEDYDATENLSGNYYYVASDEGRIIGPKGMNDRTSYGSGHRSPRRDDVTLRDDGLCIATGMGGDEVVQAHLIPHSKGDPYIQNLLTIRLGQSQGDWAGIPSMDRLDSIDDARNIISLVQFLHTRLKTPDLAFLQVPNFAMTSEDLRDPDAPDVILPVFHTQDRIQVHFMDPAILPTFYELHRSQRCCHGSYLRIPADTSNWPRPVLWDFAYGVASLQRWSSGEHLQKHKSTERYYNPLPFESDSAHYESNEQRDILGDLGLRDSTQTPKQTDDLDPWDRVWEFWQAAAAPAVRRARDEAIECWRQTVPIEMTAF